jgi:hypothetical protein
MAAMASACTLLPLMDKEILLLWRSAAADNKKDNDNWMGHHQ